jgi:uncharacterized protein
MNNFLSSIFGFMVVIGCNSSVSYNCEKCKECIETSGCSNFGINNKQSEDCKKYGWCDSGYHDPPWFR